MNRLFLADNEPRVQPSKLGGWDDLNARSSAPKASRRSPEATEIVYPGGIPCRRFRNRPKFHEFGIDLGLIGVL
jgi:hypothetical protein